MKKGLYGAVAYLLSTMEAGEAALYTRTFIAVTTYLSMSYAVLRQIAECGSAGNVGQAPAAVIGAVSFRFAVGPRGLFDTTVRDTHPQPYSRLTWSCIDLPRHIARLL